MTDFELLIVDDGSTDGCLDFLDSNPDPRITVLTSDINTGAAGARNRGLEAATSPLIALADADDMAHPLRLELQVDHFTRHPGVDLLAGATQLFGHRSVVGTTSWPVTTHELLSLGLRFGPSFYHGSVMVKTEALRAIGGYRDVPPAEDYDMYGRLLVNGGRFEALPSALLIYRNHAGGISKTRTIDARRVHRETSNWLRESVEVPALRQLVLAARAEPALTRGEPRLRALKLLGRTAVDTFRRDPTAGIRCAVAAAAMGPGPWLQLMRSSRRAGAA